MRGGKSDSDSLVMVVVFFPWVIITGDFTKFLPACKMLLDMAKMSKKFNTEIEDKITENVHVTHASFSNCHSLSDKLSGLSLYFRIYRVKKSCGMSDTTDESTLKAELIRCHCSS